MKIIVDIDCTPAEARAFLGLPDLQPMQTALMNQLQDRLSASLQAMDGDALLRTWLPAGFQGMEQLYRSFLTQMELAMGKEHGK